MNATLSQIQTKLAEVRELRTDALANVRALALGSIYTDAFNALMLVSKFDGYEREFWALTEVERELISNGRTETRFDAPHAQSAAVTPPAPSDAQNGPREAPRNDASNPLLPSAGDCF